MKKILTFCMLLFIISCGGDFVEYSVKEYSEDFGTTTFAAFPRDKVEALEYSIAVIQGDRKGVREMTFNRAKEDNDCPNDWIAKSPDNAKHICLGISKNHGYDEYAYFTFLPFHKKKVEREMWTVITQEEYDDVKHAKKRKDVTIELEFYVDGKVILKKFRDPRANLSFDDVVLTHQGSLENARRE